MLEHEEEGGAEDRPDQRARAADDHHDQHLARTAARTAAPCWRSRRTAHRARRRARRARRRWRRRRSCRGGCCSRAPASWPRSRGCRAAPRRTASAPGRGTAEGSDQAGQREIVEAGLGRQQRDAERARAARNAGEPVRAAGHRRPFEGDGIEQLGEGQRQHRERDAGRERAHPADADGDDAGQQARRGARRTAAASTSCSSM